MAHIDADLLNELHLHAEHPVEAIVVLHSSLSFNDSVSSLLHDVEKTIQQVPDKIVLFKNIHSFSIRATSTFLEYLLQDARVHSATLNR